MSKNAHATDISAMLDAAEGDSDDLADIRETVQQDLAEEFDAVADRLDRIAIRGPDPIECRARDLEVDCRELARILQQADGRLEEGDVAEAMFRDPSHGGGD